MRSNPFKMKRPTILVEDKPRVFTDPLQPGEELAVYLAADPARPALYQREERAAKLIEEYLPVSKEEFDMAEKMGIAPRVPTPVTVPGSPPPQITRKLCGYIATLMDMGELCESIREVPADAKPRTFKEWVFFSQNMPNAFDAAVAHAGDLLLQAEGKLDDPNSLAESTAKCSDSPLTDSTEATIPNLSSAVTP